MANSKIDSKNFQNKTNPSTELNEAITISVCNDLIQINESFEKRVTIDSDIGRNTNFSICSEDMNKFSISIISPNKQQFDLTSSEFKIDESYKRYQLSLKRADSGVWSIHFKTNTNEKLSVTVLVTSQPLNSNPIEMNVWLKEADSQTPPIIIAEIRKGSNAVIGAEVVATIDKPDGTLTSVTLNNCNNYYCNFFLDKYMISGQYNVSVLAKNDSNKCQLKSFIEASSGHIGFIRSVLNYFKSNNQQTAETSGVQNVQNFERQDIVGCFKLADFKLSKPNSSFDQYLKELSKSDSFKLNASFKINNGVETPAPRIAKAQTATAKTSMLKITDEQLNEIKTAKENLREKLIVVKKLVTFSKLTYVEQGRFNKTIEEIDTFIYSSKPTTMQEVDSNRVKLEELKNKLSNK